MKQVGIEQMKRKRDEKETRRKQRLQWKRKQRKTCTSQPSSAKHLHSEFHAPTSTAKATPQVSTSYRHVHENASDDDIFLVDDSRGNETDDSMLGKRKDDKFHLHPSVGTSSDAMDHIEPEDEEPEQTQLIFCSRTHSQLTQVLNELRKTRFCERFKAVTLAGRKQLCVNPEVLKLGSASRINEACMDLQRPSRSKAKTSQAGCPYLSKKACRIVNTDMFFSPVPTQCAHFLHLQHSGRTGGCCS